MAVNQVLHRPGFSEDKDNPITGFAYRHYTMIKLTGGFEDERGAYFSHPVPTRAQKLEKGTLQILSLIPEPDNFRRKRKSGYHRAP